MYAPARRAGRQTVAVPLPLEPSSRLELSVLDCTYDVLGPPAVLAVLASLFPAVPPSGTRRRVEVVEGWVLVDGVPAQEVPLREHTLEVLLMVLNAQSINDCRGYAVHAGAVARNGAVVAFPAVSGTGKSTLTAACLRAGLLYVSDEALVLDWEDGAVRSYPKPLTLSAWSAEAVGLVTPPDGLAERPVTAAELGGDVAVGPLALAHVVLLERGSTDLEARPRPDIATALLRHSFNHHRRPVQAFALATLMARSAHCWTLRYNNPADGAELVAELLS
jgi:hypothetical protein